MISTLTWAARGPFKTLDSINSPALVNAKGGLVRMVRRFPQI